MTGMPLALHRAQASSWNKGSLMLELKQEVRKSHIQQTMRKRNCRPFG